MSASSSKTSSTKSPQDLGGDVSAELAQIRQDIAALTKTLGAYGEDRLGGLSDMASKSSQETLASAKHAIDEVRREIEAVERNVEGKVAEHPMQSVLIAVGLGFLVAFLIRR